MGLLNKLGKAITGQEQNQGNGESGAQIIAKKLLKALLKLLSKILTTKLFMILLPVIIALFLIVLIWNGMINISSQSSAKAASTIKESTRFEGGAIVVDEDIYERIRDQLRLDGIDPDAIFLGEDYDYLEKMVNASIVTSYPDTSGRVYTLDEVTNMADSELWIAATDGELSSRPSSSDTPANGEAIKNAVARNLQMISVPIWVWENPGTNDMRRKAITWTQPINAAVAPIYIAFFEELFSLGSETSGFVIDTSNSGTGAPRAPTGGIGWASMHVYGAAFDLNYGTRYAGDLTNGYWDWGNRGPYSESEWRAMPEIQAKYETIYIGSDIAKLAEKYDMAWGGDWTNHDMMHFSFFGEKTRTGINVDEAFTRSGTTLTGIGQIYRERNGARTKLTYVSEAAFNSMLERNTTDILNCFTVDKDVNVIVAKYNKLTVINEEGETEVTYDFSKVTLPYRNKVSQYAMPFEFMYILMVTTLNPEFVGAVADLALEHTTIEMTIMDSISIDTTKTLHSYNETTTVTITEDGTLTSTNTNTEAYSGLTTIINEINSITADITKVETWVYKKSATYTSSHRPEMQVGETTITKDLDPDDERYQDKEISNTSRRESVESDPPETPARYINKVTTTVVDRHDIQDFVQEYFEEWVWTSTPDPSDEAEINPGLFLGLWQNDTGEYEPGARYNPEGEIVLYLVPNTGFKKSPAVTICDSPEFFFYQLGATETTQSYEDLMRYILYIYTGKSYGVTEENVGELLNMFKTPTRFSASGMGFWWPIGSIDTEMEDGKTFAKGDPSLTTVGCRLHCNCSVHGGRHNGIDVPSGGQTNRHNVIAVADGVVTFVADGMVDSSDASSGGYGNYVKVRHNNGMETTYAHLYRGSIPVSMNEEVKQGQVLGKVGSSGASTGPHLHFEVRDAGGSVVESLEYVNPDNPRPVGGFGGSTWVAGDNTNINRYMDDILEFAELYDVPPGLIYEIIRRESSGNPNARNGANNCHGLMQLHQSYRETWARNAGVSNFDVFNPRHNIQVGTYLISTHIQSYNGNMVFALSAYNAGGGNLNKWVREGKLSYDFDDETNANNIPFRETRNYVNLIWIQNKANFGF